MRILFVENHAVFADLAVRKFLAAHEVTVAPTLAAARAALEAAAEPFGAVLVDFDLDDGKGDELVRQLRREGFDGTIVAASAHQAGNEALQAAGADARCAKGDFDGIEEVLRAARGAGARRSRGPALPAPAAVEAADVEGISIHSRAEGPRYGRVVLARGERGFMRRVDRDEAGEPFDEEGIAGLVEAVTGPLLERPSIEELGLDLELASAASESRALRWSSREELQALVERAFAPGAGEPACQVRVRIEFSRGRRATLDTESERAFLLPWIVVRPGEGPRKAFDARIGRALASLVPASFPNADRMAGTTLLDDLGVGPRMGDAVLVAPMPPAASPLMVAAREGRLDEVASLLASGAEVDETDERGWTALVYAVHGDSLRAEMNLLKVARALLEAGADRETRDAGGRTPLDHAIEVESTRRFELEVAGELSSPGRPLPASVGPHRTSLRGLLSRP